MSEIKPLDARDRRRSGKFTDLADSLLPLFSDPPKGANRDWRLLFGIEPPPPPPRDPAVPRDLRRPPTRKR